MKAKFLDSLVLGFFFISILALFPLRSQEAIDYGKVLGTWEIEVDAEGEFYYLAANIKKSDGELSGTISEATGALVDAPLSNIQFDGEILSFEFTSPIPPDGYERLVKAEFEVGDDDTLDGIMSVDDLGIIVSATGKRTQD